MTLERVGMTEDEFGAAEAAIERGLETFVEVGQALMAIRDGHGYRLAGFTSFETYCQERWSIVYRHANRLIDAAKVVAAVGPIGPTPTNEAQARELVPVLRDEGPGATADVWREAVETAPGGKVTAAHVQAVVEHHRQPQHIPVTVRLASQQDTPIPSPKREFNVEQVEADLEERGFDLSTLPSPRLSRGQKAFYAIPNLGNFISVPPSEVADAAETQNRLEADVAFFGSIDSWLKAVIQEIDQRRQRPIRLVKDSA